MSSTELKFLRLIKFYLSLIKHLINTRAPGVGVLGDGASSGGDGGGGVDSLKGNPVGQKVPK